MRSSEFLPALMSVLLTFAAGCQARQPEEQVAPSAAPPETSAASAPVPSPASPPPAVPAASTPATSTAAPPVAPAPAPAATLASQQSNWPGVVADVTEFRRKGSTLTAKVVLRNQGNVESEPDIHYNEAYLMDLGAGKKYEVLKDEKGNVIAALRSGYSDRWYQRLPPGGTYTIWIKFPAPPADVKAVTLQLPGIPPFEDLAIQDS
jgi:hypothetical protein